MAQTADLAVATAMLRAALRFGKTRPDIDQAEFDLLLIQAAVVTDEGTVYTTASLNAAAAQGWTWKASQAAAGYDDKGGGSGVHLKRLRSLSDLWSGYASAYASGHLDVLGGVAPGPPARVSGSIGMVTDLAVDYPYE